MLLRTVLICARSVILGKPPLQLGWWLGLGEAKRSWGLGGYALKTKATVFVDGFVEGRHNHG